MKVNLSEICSISIESREELNIFIDALKMYRQYALSKDRNLYLYVSDIYDEIKDIPHCI